MSIKERKSLITSHIFMAIIVILGSVFGASRSLAVEESQEPEVADLKSSQFEVFNNNPNKVLFTPLYVQDLTSGFLADYQEMLTNEMVEFPVNQAENPAKRQFFMSFGSMDMFALDGGRSQTLPQLGKPFNQVEPSYDRHPQLARWGIVAKAEKPGTGAKPNIQYMTSQYLGGGYNFSALDFEVYMEKELANYSYKSIVAKNTGRVEKLIQGGSATVDLLQTGRMPIRHLFKSKESGAPALIAYADVTNKDKQLIGYLRMLLKPEGDKGRISNNITFQAVLDTPMQYSFAQGHHADLAGNHYDTVTRSIGRDGGIYMESDGTSPKQKTPDATPYRLYYYTDGYANAPDAATYTGNIDKMAHYTTGYLFDYKPLSSGYPVDPGRNEIIPNQHPAYGWWFKARQLERGDLYEMRIDQAVTSEKWNQEREVITRYLDESGQPLETELSVQWDKDDLRYTTDAKSAYFLAKGWALDKSKLPANANGDIGVDDTPIIVEYYYQDQRKNTLTIKYQDTAGNELAPDSSETYKVGETYTANALNLSGKGWTLTDPSATPQIGQMGTTPLELVFKYRKGQVTVITEYYKKMTTGNLEPLFPAVSTTYEYLKDYQTLSRKKEALDLGYILASDNTGAPTSGVTGQSDRTLTVKYVFIEGAVALTAPATVDFGVKNIVSVGEKTILPTENIKVSIVDQLTGKWELLLAISDTITNDKTNTKIKGKFYFTRNDGTSDDLSATPIKIKTKSVEGVISKMDLEWESQQEKGLLFTQYPGNQKGGYSGQFTWTLQDAL